MKVTNLKLGQILMKSGVLTEQQLTDALHRQKASHQRLGEILIESKYITEMQMISSLAQQLSIAYIDLATVKLDDTLSSIMPEALAQNHLIVPIKREGSVLTVALADPLDYNSMNDVGTFTKLKIYPMIAERSKIETRIKELYAAQKAYSAANEMISSKAKEIAASAAANAGQEDNDSTTDQPIIRFVNNMIEQAVLLKASDIHIEPQEKSMHIRFRIDGHLNRYMETGSEIIPAVVSRIKFIGGMNIAEKRIPQDGRISYKIDGKEIDLRISILPCVFGEKVVIRITTALDFILNKQSIGFLPENLERFDKLIRNNHGIILLTGPTGSGKSTTLYTAIKEIMREDINIVTAENPVEMIIPGITQVEVNDKTGLTFASVLRSVLRQDPDVVMIGEIRDRETAEIATACAITGHLVFSTLHTYDAPSSVIRLIDMGIKPYMVSSAILGVIAQRLVRKLCPQCKERYLATETDLALLGLKPTDKIQLYRSHGCSYCNNKGYKGRTAIHEVMTITSAIKRCIHVDESVETIRQTAITEGMISLDENMRKIVLAGLTSTDELLEMNSFQM